MTESKVRAITIVAKASLDQVLSTRLREWGVREYSLARSLDIGTGSDVVGGDEHRYSRIEAIVSGETAHTIARRLATEFCADSSVVCFVSDIPAQDAGGYVSGVARQGQVPREQPWGDYLVTI